MPEEDIKRTIEGKEARTPRPNLLDVVMIDGKLAQVLPVDDRICFLKERARTGKINAPIINWDDYDGIVVDEEVQDLVARGEITNDEYNAIHYGPEQKESPHLRDYVTFFGRFTKKKK